MITVDFAAPLQIYYHFSQSLRSTDHSELLYFYSLFTNGASFVQKYSSLEFYYLNFGLKFLSYLQVLLHYFPC